VEEGAGGHLKGFCLPLLLLDSNTGVSLFGSVQNCPVNCGVQLHSAWYSSNFLHTPPFLQGQSGSDGGFAGLQGLQGLQGMQGLQVLQGQGVSDGGLSSAVGQMFCELSCC